MIISIDTKKAKKFDPNITVITAKDIPGKNDIAPIFEDEPIFAEKEVTYVGQPIGLIVASSMERARAAVNEVEIVYKKDKTPKTDFSENKTVLAGGCGGCGDKKDKKDKAPKANFSENKTVLAGGCGGCGGKPPLRGALMACARGAAA